MCIYTIVSSDSRSMISWSRAKQLELYLSSSESGYILAQCPIMRNWVHESCRRSSSMKPRQFRGYNITIRNRVVHQKERCLRPDSKHNAPLGLGTKPWASFSMFILSLWDSPPLGSTSPHS